MKHADSGYDEGQDRTGDTVMRTFLSDTISRAKMAKMRASYIHSARKLRDAVEFAMPFRVSSGHRLFHRQRGAEALPKSDSTPSLFSGLLHPLLRGI